VNREILEGLLDLNRRKELYKKILDFCRDFGNNNDIQYKEFKIKDGIFPTIIINSELNLEDINCVKIFIGAQHNEYNGLFGILRFLKKIQSGELKPGNFLREDQVLIFFPIMNIWGFLNPTSENKSGYYLKNNSNLNRFWRRVFVERYYKEDKDIINYPDPDQTAIFKSIIDKYWRSEQISIYIVDFHETSLLERFPRDLSLNLTPYYKFDHWLKEAIIENIIAVYNQPSHYVKPLFYKCGSTIDHTHINLSYKQVDTVLENLRKYMHENQNKLAFYFCYAENSKEYCLKIAKNVYQKLKDILWTTKYPAYPHDYHDHGCFVKMSDATPRKNVFAFELENQKQFFNIFTEIERAKNNPEYFDVKLNIINKSLKLVEETIKNVILID